MIRRSFSKTAYRTYSDIRVWEDIAHIFYGVTYADSKPWLDPWSLRITVNTRTCIHTWMIESCIAIYWIYDEGGLLDRGERIGNRNEELFAFKKIASKSHRRIWSDQYVLMVWYNVIWFSIFIEQSALSVSDDYIAKQ